MSVWVRRGVLVALRSIYLMLDPPSTLGKGFLSGLWDHRSEGISTPDITTTTISLSKAGWWIRQIGRERRDRLNTEEWVGFIRKGGCIYP